MAVRPVLKMGDPLLLQTATPVERFDAPELRELLTDMQDTMTASPFTLASPASLLQMSISLVARTDRDVEGISTAATPALLDAARPNNNSLGNHPSVALPAAGDPALQGSRIYRYTTFVVDLRNLGVGR